MSLESTERVDPISLVPAPSSPPAAPAGKQPDRLYGRDRELAMLARILEQNDPGVRLVEVSGDPWIGKSLLLDVLGDLARGQDWKVAVTAAGSLLEALPFGVFADALDDLLTPYGDALVDGFPPHHMAWLAGIFPTLARHAPDVVLPGNPSEMNHVFHAVRSLLDNLGSRHRLLLIIDDMHWADEESVLLLDYLVRHPTTSRVLLVVAHRPRQDQHNLRILLDEAAATGRSARIELRPLADEDLVELLPDGLIPSQQHRLRSASEGSPGLLRALRRLDQWAEEDEPPDPARLSGPSGSAEPPMSLLREFRGLSPLGRTVAHSAALVQEPFDTALLAQAAQVTEAEATAGVDELVRQDILRPDETRRTFRFRNRPLRSTAYQMAGAAWRLGAHTRAAAVLRDRASPPPQIARHLGRSVIDSQDTAGIRILEEAASATLWERPDQSASWMRAALDLLPHRPDGNRQQHLHLAIALALSGKLTESLDAFDRTPPDEMDTSGDAWLWRAQVLRLLGRHAESAELLEKAIANLPLDAHETRARTAGALLATMLEAGQPQLSLTIGTSVDDTGFRPALRALLPALQSLASAADGDTHGLTADRVVAAGKLIDKLPDETLRPWLDTLYWLGRAEHALGQDTAALGHLERALGLATRHRLHYIVPQLTTLTGHVLLGVGETAAAERRADYARLAADRIGSAFQAWEARALHGRIDHPGAPGTPVVTDRTGPDPLSRAQVSGADPVAEAETGAGERLPEATTELQRLSGRERQISVLVSNGRTNQQIARTLELSPKTVETYLARIFKKLGLCSRAQLAALVGREGHMEL
ncbi:helix-turn-helix transcriptional regulator [Streptomyces incanus]